MSGIGKNLVFVVTTLLFCACARADVADSANPYQTIVERNLFHLKPPPPPPTNNPATDKQTASKITINGIATITGKKQVFMTVQMPAKPPEPSKPQTLFLAEGQREDGIEVLQIDEAAGIVKVNNFGTPVTLTMDKDGAKLPASAPAPTPGAPNPVAGINPGAPNQFAANTAAPNPAGLTQLPTRIIRKPGMATDNNNNIGGTGVGGVAGGPGGFVGQPGIQVGAPAPGQPVPVMSADEQALNMLAQHVQHTDQGIEMPPLPPPLAELLGPNSPQPNNANPTPTAPRPLPIQRAPGLPTFPVPLPQ